MSDDYSVYYIIPDCVVGRTYEDEWQIVVRKERSMKKIYFTLTGTNHYYGQDYLKQGDKVKLKKEPDNEYDKEAIRVEYRGLGKIGYVANSPRTVAGESISAGRMYDLFKKKAKAKVEVILPYGALCVMKIK